MVPLDHEQMEQIDTIKNAIKKDFKNLGFDHKPESVNDLMALEYALAFTSEIISLKNIGDEDEEIEIKNYAGRPGSGRNYHPNI